MKVQHARFHDVSQRFPRVSRPLGQFVQEQEATVCQGPSAGHWVASAVGADQAGHAAGGMGGQKRHPFVSFDECMGCLGQA